jgi:hypothetical protein
MARGGTHASRDEGSLLVRRGRLLIRIGVGNAQEEGREVCSLRPWNASPVSFRLSSGRLLE